MKIVIHCTTGQCGTDSWVFVEVADNSSSDELYVLADEYARDNAEMYGIYPPSEDDEYPDEGSDDNIEGSWKPYDPAKHDRYIHTGTPVWYELS